MPWKEKPKLPTKTTIEVKEGQYTMIPTSTNKVLFGPAKIDITRHPGGAVHGTILEGEVGLLNVAVRQRLERVGW